MKRSFHKNRERSIFVQVKSNHFYSKFTCPPKIVDLMRETRILANDETPQKMMQRVISALFHEELRNQASLLYNGKLCTLSRATKDFEIITHLIDEKICIFGTPILMNAGTKIHAKDLPLNACIVPPVRWGDKKSAWEQNVSTIGTVMDLGMGTGFNLDDTNNPIELLKWLNEISIKKQAELKGKGRPPANMGVINAQNPFILEIIKLKIGADQRGEDWKFNISVNISDEFMRAVRSNSSILMLDGSIGNANIIFNIIAEAAYLSGDPGILFMERYNQDNPVPQAGKYVSTAPCAEVALAPGEVCQFGYINLGKCLMRSQNSLKYKVNTKTIKIATRVLTRALDNALEISIRNNPLEESQKIMREKRKIGIGVCGFADMLEKLGIQYDTEKARKLAQNIIALINYNSKKKSYCLAKEKGSFYGIFHSDCQYISTPGFIERKFANIETKYVSQKKWISLANKIRQNRCLRNSTTVALPPTGRSSLILEASSSIEPFFTKDPLSLTKTALEISPENHLLMLGSIIEVVDDAVSKTINLPNNATIEDIKKLYMKAYDLGLKGITVYRNNCRLFQPKNL